MNFDLHLYGETPEELLNVLAHLGHMDSNYHTPIPDERHPAQTPAPQPQSEPVPPQDKTKAQTPAKAKKAAQKPAAAPAEELANPTSQASSSGHHAGAECSAVAGTAAETPSGSGTTARTSGTNGTVTEAPVNPTAADTSASASKKDVEPDASDSAAVNPTTFSAESPTTAGTSGSTPEPDPAMLDKIRDLARSLIVHGKRAEVQQIIKSTGAVSISKLPPDSYTDVWQQLVNLSKEVDSNAAD